MIVGDESKLAIESGITCAYQERGLVALGYFLIHVDGREYGVRAPDATMLANSLDSVKARVKMKGEHTFFAQEEPAKEVAAAFLDVTYRDVPEARQYFGMSHEMFSEAIVASGLVWAPDGDSAFDDGSCVLQFDIGSQVRLIAFKSGDDGHVESLSEVFVDGDEFYQVLRSWVDAFEREWKVAPKNKSLTSH